MLEEIIINSFSGSQSFVITVSRFFLTFSVAIVGAYAREYQSMLSANKKCSIDIRKIMISAFIPSLLSITFFDGIVKIINVGALLLFSFVAGFLGFDILRDIKTLGVKGMITCVTKFLSSLNPATENSMLNKCINICNTLITSITKIKADNAAKAEKNKKT